MRNSIRAGILTAKQREWTSGAYLAITNKYRVYFWILHHLVSDTCFKKENVDRSGPNIEHLLLSGKLFYSTIVTKECVPDENNKIQNVLKSWADEQRLDLILTTGGTGFSPRDVTPEATKAVIDREAQALASAMVLGCQKYTPLSILSRSVCGIRGQTLILNLPGSLKGSQECLEQVAEVIPHIIDQLQENKEKLAETHKTVQFSHHGHDHGKSQVDVSRIAERVRHSPYPLISVKEAQEIVLQESQIMDTEYVNFRDSLGRILAEDVVARDPLPPFPASMKDGYAVIAEDGAGYRVVKGDATAGAKPDEYIVTPGTCVRVSTGGPIPTGADAVVQVEDTEVTKKDKEGKLEYEINILKAPKSGQDIRPIGSDIKKGQTILTNFEYLGAAEIGLLAAAGICVVLVYKQPTVAVLSTGNEIVEPDASLRPGCIRDSNKTSLIMLLKEQHFKTVDAGIARDSPDHLQMCLESIFEKADVIVSTGGVSMGEKDIMKQVLEIDFGATIHFGRIFMKPGKPTTFSTLTYNGKTKLVFGLPGNPVSAMVTCHLYVIPSLRKMMGYKNPMYKTVKAKLSSVVVLDPRPEYHRAALCWLHGDIMPTAFSTGNQLSSRLLSMTSANALLMLPPCDKQQTKLPAGSEVDALLIQI